MRNEAVHSEITASRPEFSRLSSGITAMSMAPPTLVATDDTAEAKWFNLDKILKIIEFGYISHLDLL